MTLPALVMAGGSGERMRSSGVPVSKPLVPVLGVPLLERNVHALLRAGFRKIIVAVPGGIPEVAAFVRGHLAALARAAGAEVDCFIEMTPLGNIGCAGLLRRQTDALLVVYADNLTTFDLRLMAAGHFAGGADMTIATHKQPFRMPFGEVRIEGGEVRAYLEKPVYSYDVCSAVSLLGSAALCALPDDRPTGISELVQSLIRCGRRVRSVPHSAPWIDVNDAASIPLAESLVAAHQRDFDLWADHPSEAAPLLCEIAGGRARLSPPRRADGRWTLPGSGDNRGEPLMTMDDLEEESSGIRRFSIECRRRAEPPQGADAGWRLASDALADDDVSPLAKRALAFAMHAPETS